MRKEIQEGALRDAGIARLAYRRAEDALEIRKNELLNEFRSHSVTQEINGGPYTSNKSNTLNGYGNLFSFIGFNVNETPALVAEDYLEKTIQLKEKPIITPKIKQINYSYEVVIPTDQELDANNPMPDWDTGGWMTKIEQGISGLGHYLFAVFGSNVKSESTRGLQKEKQLRTLEYKPTSYITQIFNNFKSKLSKRR